MNVSNEIERVTHEAEKYPFVVICAQIKKTANDRPELFKGAMISGKMSCFANGCLQNKHPAVTPLVSL